MRELGEVAIHPNELMLFSDMQYSHPRFARAHDEDRFLRHRVPERFDPDARIEWTPIWPLGGRQTEPKYLPAASSWFLFQGQSGDESGRMCVADSNGCSAGSNLTEAAVHAAYEVIERDAVAMWWHPRLSRPEVPIDSLDSPQINAVSESLAQRGARMWLLDLTTDVRVPAMAAVAARPDGSEVVFGFGCHLDPRSAAETATLELSQFYAAFDTRPHDPYGAFGVDGRDWWGRHTLATDEYLVPAGATEGSWSVESSRDLREDLDTITTCLHGAGLQAYLLDQSRPAVPELSVAKVIVPGARHMCPRFAPGRLYQVPMELGWTDEVIREEDLNPTAIFF